MKLLSTLLLLCSFVLFGCSVAGQPVDLSTSEVIGAPAGSLVWAARPVGVCLDGPRAAELKPVPNFFSGVRWENALVSTEILRDANGNNLVGRYPNVPNHDSDIVEWWTNEEYGWPRFREGLIQYAKRTFKPGEVAYCSLDYENELYLFNAGPAAMGDTDPAVFEEYVARFLIESLRVCNQVRPDVKWTIWQYPKPNWTEEQILSRMEVFNEMEWLGISVYSFGADDPKWQQKIRDRGAQVAFLQSVHKLGTALDVVAASWNDTRGGRGQAEVFDLVRIMREADKWATFHVFWIGAGHTDVKVQQNQECLLPGGNVYEAVTVYRAGPFVDP